MQPLGPVAEEWLAAYRMVPEGRAFGGVASALRGILQSRPDVSGAMAAR